jgi:tetratricopeptide (TPR) repeat protein
MEASPTISQPTARREAAVLLTLSAIAIVTMAGVFALVNRFHQWQASLAARLYGNGQWELQRGNPAKAIENFRSALAFQGDNYEYQLSLAQALEAAGRYDEAESYLLNLWERQPQDGMVNLQLARLAAHRHLTNQALRYYHNAIYGLWQQNPDQNRRVARFELIDYLIRESSPAQAQAEILAMAAGLPPDPELIDRAAGLFMEIRDYENALDQFRHAYQLDRKNMAAAQGAGEAAFKMGRYKTAQRYLEIAVNGGRTQAHDMLATVDLVLSSDPFRRNLPSKERVRRAQSAYQAASNRLQNCMESHGETAGGGAPSSLQQLEEQRQQLKPKLRVAATNPDLLESIMNFVFDVEETTEQECGPPGQPDRALLLIGRNREGVER